MGLSPTWQDRHLEEEVHSYSFRVEDDVTSSGYPGLITTYCIHEVSPKLGTAIHGPMPVLGKLLGEPSAPLVHSESLENIGNGPKHGFGDVEESRAEVRGSRKD